MKINWFTVIAQVINFLVLVWLLKRFLYKPILSAIDDREKKIAAQIKDAGDKSAVAIKAQNDFAKKNDDFDKQKKGLTDKAILDSNALRDKLFETAKTEAGLLRANLEKASQENQAAENLQAAQKTQKQVFAITRKVLTDIASTGLEEQSTKIFISHLSESDDGAKKQFIEAFKSNGNDILIRSAFGLSVKQQNDINLAVDTILGAKTQLHFKTTPELISGIELTTNGYKMAWSFSAYLNSLEKNITERSSQLPEIASEKT
jgi:F-type H+-transporting ATPase subunit b